MSRPIDEKIVAMKMDNSDFKRKASETTSLFGKLTSSLKRIPSTNIGNITRDLGGIQRSVNGVSLDGLGKSVDQIASRFSNLGVVATTALANIANKATNALTSAWKGVTTDPIMDGFREYETKMGSIQTILANTQAKGTDLTDVKNSLEALNKYADKTIYSFADMTKNIGLFTNAGLGLEESTSMIKGFSNAAAASGANAENTARAAYQMSQGLASGYLMQMDWMSLTNAGMGNDNMKRDLIAIGKAKGTLDKKLSDDAVVKDWKALLTDEKWLTSDVMSTYLQAMAGDMSKAKLQAIGLTDAQSKLLLQNAKTGEESATYIRTFSQLMGTIKESVGSSWATSFEIIFGDFEAATKLFTGINDAVSPFFSKQGEARNAVLKAVFQDGKSLQNLLGGMKNLFSPVAALLKGIGAGFRMAFPPTGASGIKAFLESFKGLTNVFKISEGSVNNLKTIFGGFFSIFAIGFKVIAGAGKMLLSLLPSFDGLGAKILDLIAMVFKVPLAFNKATTSSEMFSKVLDFLKPVADGIANILEGVVDGLIVFAEAVGSAWNILAKGDFKGGPWAEDSNIVDKLFKIREAVIGTVDAVKAGWAKLSGNGFKGPWDGDSKILQWAGKIKEALSGFGSALANSNFSLEPIANGFVSFFNTIKAGFDWIVDKVKMVGAAIKENMPSGDQLMAGGFFTALVGVVGMALKMTWDWYNIFTNLGGGIGDSLEGIGDALGSFALQLKAQALLLAAIAVGILAASLYLLQDLNYSQIASGLYAMIASMSGMVAALAVMDKFSIVGGGFQAVLQIIAMSIAFAILSTAIKRIGTMNWEEITKGLFGMIGTMAAFSLAVAAMSKFGGANIGASALQIVAISVAMLLMASVIKKIGAIDVGSLVKGLTVITVVLAQLGLFIKLTSGAKFGVGATIGMLAMGTAIKSIVSAVEKIADIDVGALVKGLTTITLILAAVTAFSMFAGPNMLGAGAGILLMAAALTLLIIPVATFGNMDLSTLAIGLGAMAVAMLAIAGAAMLMTSGIAGAFAMIIIAGALTLLIVPITTLGTMTWGTILTGIFGLALALGVLGGTAALLGLVAPAMLSFVLVLGLASVAMALAGVGVSLLAIGLVNLAALGAAAVTTIVATLATLIAGLVSLIPAAVNLVIRVVLAIADAIATNAPILFAKGAEMMLGLLNVLKEKIPQFVTVAADIITNFLNTLAAKAPELALAGSNLMVSMIEAMAVAVQTNGPRFQNAINTLMAEVLVIVVNTGISVIQALFGWIPGVQDATNQIGQRAEDTIRNAFGAAEVGTEKGQQFASSLGGQSGAAQSAGNGVAKGAESGASNVNMNPIGTGAGSDFASGILSQSGAAGSSGTGLATAGKVGAGSIDMSGTGSNFGMGFANGITGGGVLDRVISAGKSIASAAKRAVTSWLNIQSPSRVMMKDGGFFSEGFAIGISNMAGRVASSAKGVAMTARDTLTKFADQFQLPEEDNELHFKAVVDYERLDTSNFGRLGGMSLRPDVSLTNGLFGSVKSKLVQNGNSSPEVAAVVNAIEDTAPKQPLVVQTMLNGRVLAEQIIDDVSRLQNQNQTMLDRARGVL